MSVPSALRSLCDARILRCCGGIMPHSIPRVSKRAHSAAVHSWLQPPEEDYEREAEYESPYTYTTRDYSQHTEFVTW